MNYHQTKNQLATKPAAIVLVIVGNGWKPNSYEGI